MYLTLCVFSWNNKKKLIFILPVSSCILVQLMEGISGHYVLFYGSHVEEISTWTCDWLENHFHPSTASIILSTLGSISTNSKHTAQILNETNN